MFRNIAIGVCGLVFAAVLSFPAFADQSIAYQEYFHKGVKAFEQHDDQEAFRCFKIAQIYDPSDVELNNYISILEKRGVSLDQSQFSTRAEDLIGYKYYLAKGIEELQQQHTQKAIYYFNIAIIFNPDSKEVDQYLENLGQSAVQPQVNAQVVPPVIPQVQPIPSPSVGSQPVETPVPSSSPETVMPPPQPMPASTVQPIYIAVPKPKMPVAVILLSQLGNNGRANPKVQIELNSSLIVEGKNIQRFLVIQEGFIGVRGIDHDHLEIDAVRIGTTFLHIWDDQGRHTFFVEVIFPKAVNPNGVAQETNGIQHAKPFKVTYTNDWDTYYAGKNVPDLKRQSSEFNQTLGVTGETPYGFFDTSGSYTDYDGYSQIDTYTIGLSQIPLEGTSDFNLRGFDASRYLSPLTMPTTRLRGAFADVDLMDDIFGLSVSHGQEQTPIGFIPMSQQNQFNDSYIDAAKLTLFPKSQSDQYSLNLATAYGSDRQSYLADHVYSVEGQHQFNDFLTLNAEEGSDTSHDATLASLKWQDGLFKSGLNFRNIDKSYSTISTLPSYQGETGMTWTTEGDFKRFTENTFVEMYRDRLNLNPDDTGAYNYDGSGQVRVNITDDIWSDSDLNFVDTPGEISPNRSLELNERISKSFGIWNSLKGTVYSGVGFQDSHSSDTDISNYDREDVIVGGQLPLTRQVSAFANYEYDFLHQPDAGGNSYPSVINAGLNYEKQITSKLSFNSQASYHDELGVKPNSDSFLSGEQSVILSSGFNYNPSEDVNVFANGNVSKVFSNIGSPSYDDFEIEVGMRLTFGGATYWDPLGTVSGIVFKDRNGDGKFGPGDEGIAGVKVKVGDKTAVTDKDGRYHIQIRAKGVDVIPDLDTIPGGLLFSTPQSLQVRIFQGRVAHADFGLTSQTGIYGIVFVSKNGLTVPNDGDRFIGKVRVVLDGKIIQKSDSHGAFYFRKVSPGAHTISVDINTLALDMVPLIKLQNKIDVAEGTNYMFNVPVQIKKAEGDEE